MKYFTNKGKKDLIKLLKITCSYPGYFLIEDINNRQYVDGNTCHLFPLDEAIKDGCTDVLVVGNTTPSDIGNLSARITHLVSRIMTRSYPVNFKKELKNKLKYYRKEADLVYRKQGEPNINIFNIYPEKRLAATETKNKNLKRFAEHGRIRAKEFFL